MAQQISIKEIFRFSFVDKYRRFLLTTIAIFVSHTYPRADVWPCNRGGAGCLARLQVVSALFVLHVLSKSSPRSKTPQSYAFPSIVLKASLRVIYYISDSDARKWVWMWGVQQSKWKEECQDKMDKGWERKIGHKRRRNWICGIQPVD